MKTNSRTHSTLSVRQFTLIAHEQWSHTVIIINVYITNRINTYTGFVGVITMGIWGLGEVEGVLSFRGGEAQFTAHDLYAAVVWQLEIVDARHDGRQVLVRIER